MSNDFPFVSKVPFPVKIELENSWKLPRFFMDKRNNCPCIKSIIFTFFFVS